MKKIIVFGIMVVSACSLHAQTSIDALRYSQSSLTGTARYSAMGGAFGALGGDFSAIANNPAAIAIYRSSELNLSSSIYVNHTNSEFLGNSDYENRFNFNIPSFGLVLTGNARNQDKAGWKSWNFGIGLNRINNFQSNTYYEGFNPSSSMLDYFVDHAGSKKADNLDPFYEGMAYTSWLIYPDSIWYTNDRLNFAPNAGILQRRSGTTKGAVNEWNFSFGANYNNLLYVGAAIGVRSLRYVDESSYEEIDRDNLIPILNSFSLDQNLTAKGSGVNFKLGAIARASDWMRIGLAVHTPTIYELHEDYNNVMKSSIEGFTDTTVNSPFGAFDYELTTPMRVIASLGFIIQQSASIGIEYEMVDYSESRFHANGYTYSDVNDYIRENYTASNNLRLGAEYRYGNISFRGGYGFSTTPFNSRARISGQDFSKTNISAGIGVRDENYFFDFAYVYSMTTEHFQPYELSYQSVPGVKNSITNHNAVFTFGIKF